MSVGPCLVQLVGGGNLGSWHRARHLEVLSGWVDDVGMEMGFTGWEHLEGKGIPA